jgi:hypothetical protein
MNSFVKITLVCMSLLLLSACATTKNYQAMLNHWQGAPVKDLMQSWGYPDAGVKLPSGNTVYMYTRQQTFIAPPTPNTTPTIINANGTPLAVTTYNGQFIGGQELTMTCRTWFEVNPQGVIVGTRFQGNNCVTHNPNRWTP